MSATSKEQPHLSHSLSTILNYPLGLAHREKENKIRSATADQLVDYYVEKHAKVKMSNIFKHYEKPKYIASEEIVYN